MKFTKRHEDTIKVEIDQKSSTISVWNNGILELVTKRRKVAILEKEMQFKNHDFGYL